MSVRWWPVLQFAPRFAPGLQLQRTASGVLRQRAHLSTCPTVTTGQSSDRHHEYAVCGLQGPAVHDQAGRWELRQRRGLVGRARDGVRPVHDVELCVADAAARCRPNADTTFFLMIFWGGVIFLIWPADPVRLSAGQSQLFLVNGEATSCLSTAHFSRVGGPIHVTHASACRLLLSTQRYFDERVLTRYFDGTTVTPL